MASRLDPLRVGLVTHRPALHNQWLENLIRNSDRGPNTGNIADNSPGNAFSEGKCNQICTNRGLVSQDHSNRTLLDVHGSVGTM